MVAWGVHAWLLPEGECVVALGGAWLLPGGLPGCSPGSMHGCSRGACMVAPEGRAWLLGGPCMVAPGGHAWLLRRGVHGCLGGHAWLLQGACVVAPGGRTWLLPGGMHGIRRDTEIRSMSGRYASYWNAFLFILFLQEKVTVDEFFVSQVNAWVEDTVYFSSGGELYNGHGWALVYQNSRYVTHLTSKSVMSNCNVIVTVD